MKYWDEASRKLLSEEDMKAKEATATLPEEKADEVVGESDEETSKRSRKR